MPLKKSLYISRPVLNSDEIMEWAREQGFKSMTPPEKLHVTVIFSTEKQDWHTVPFEADCVLEIEGGDRELEQFGQATVLRFNSELLQFRWEMLVGHGIPYKFDSYKPHITITYNLPEGSDLSGFKVYDGPIVLGPEEVEEANSDWESDHKELDL